MTLAGPYKVHALVRSRLNLDGSRPVAIGGTEADLLWAIWKPSLASSKLGSTWRTLHRS